MVASVHYNVDPSRAVAEASRMILLLEIVFTLKTKPMLECSKAEFPLRERELKRSLTVTAGVGNSGGTCFSFSNGMRKRKAPSNQTTEDSSVSGGLKVSNRTTSMLNPPRSRCVTVNPTWFCFGGCLFHDM